MMELLMNAKILNGNVLKLIAIVAMTLDHVAWAVWSVYDFYAGLLVMRVIGRLTLPIMCFLIAEGFFYTRSRAKYALRLFLFAVIAHFAFMFCFNQGQGKWFFVPFLGGDWQGQTSVMWGLAWGLILLWVFHTNWHWVWKFLAGAAIIFLTLPADWGCVAPLLILAFGKSRGYFILQMFWLVAIVWVDTFVTLAYSHSVMALINLMVIICVPVLWQYNGQRGRSVRLNRFLKWFFYLYYPLHLFVIGLLLFYGLI